MTDDRLDEEAHNYAALDGNPGDAGADEVRYGLTPLGALALEQSRSFAGFGPCAFGPACAAAAPKARASRVRKPPAPLFG